MKTTKLLILICVLLLNTVYAQESIANDNTAKAYEMPRTQVIQISNSETDTLNTLYIKLPKGYEKNTDLEYPVIYFTFPKEHIEILSAVSEILIKDVIIVGLTWSKGINFGNLDSYVNFLRNDAFKVIENNYRADANRRTYFGYSAGALVGAYILSKHPNTFKNFILGSPALGVDHEVIQKIYDLESNTAEERKKLIANVFISYGILEEKDTPHFEKFITMLKSINDESLTLQHIVVEGNHQTAMPMTAIRSMYWLSDLIKDGEFSALEDRYLGQKPPGLTPEVFAPGIVSTEHHEWGPFFTPDMKEFYFSRRNNKSGKDSHLVFKFENNRWHESEAEHGVSGEISPDGKTMFYTNQYRERTDGGWSELKSLGSAFEDIDIMRLTTSSKGTYVFDEYAKDGNFVLRYSRLINGVRETPKPLSKEINTGKQNVHPFIAPDESYILWDSKRDDGYGGSDIYVSFRQGNGSWGAAINLGDKVNTSTSQRGGYVTPDGKYLFFFGPASTGKGDVFWVDAQIIENLRPKQ